MIKRVWKRYIERIQNCEAVPKEKNEVQKERRSRREELLFSSMEIKMNKEIQEYQETIYFGLTARQFIFSVLALIVTIGIYMGTKKMLGAETAGWVCILGAAPFAGCGFFKYHEMNLEQFVYAWLKSEVLYPKRLVFQSENVYLKCMEPAIKKGYKGRRNVSDQDHTSDEKTK